MTRHLSIAALQVAGFESSKSASVPAWFASCALIIAAALLFGFYVVTQQAVAQAHVHWEKAPAARLAALDNCVSAPEYSLLHDCRQLR
jgi:hypothetical protein